VVRNATPSSEDAAAIGDSAGGIDDATGRIGDAAGATIHAPSPHQARVFDFVRAGKGHGVVRATAGSGKTSTLVGVAGLLPAGSRACFLAFNRATAAELRRRLPANVEATTLHALGRRVLHHAFPNPRARSAERFAPPSYGTGLRPRRRAGGGDAGRDGATGALRPHGHAGVPFEGKYPMLAMSIARGRYMPPTGMDPSQDSDLDVADIARYLARLAHFARLELTPASSPTAVQRLARSYALVPPVVDHRLHDVHALLPRLLREGAAAAADGVVDFTDFLYLPHVLDLPVPRFDLVCVDEAQDLSLAGLALVMRLLSRGARGLFVGDERQAIYGFAGADERSMRRIVHRTAATVLPLSRSFRCPQRVVTLARRFAPEMEAAPEAPLGAVRRITQSRLHLHVRPGDLVLSRTNAPLVRACLRLVRARVPARVLGTELAESVRALADRILPPDDLRHARRIVRTASQDTARRIASRLLTSPTLGDALRRNADDHDALDILLEALESRYLRPTRMHFDALLDTMFGGSHGALLSTIHKAKGREAERVFLLWPEELATAGTASKVADASDGAGRAEGFTDTRNATQSIVPAHASGKTHASEHADALEHAGALDQSDASERNVLFVALTRARNEFVLVERHHGAIARRLRRAGGHQHAPAEQHPEQADGGSIGRGTPDRARRATVRHEPDSPNAGADALVRDWNAVLRLASVMARSRAGRRRA